jgi:hypothetical protein
MTPILTEERKAELRAVIQKMRRPDGDDAHLAKLLEVYPIDNAQPEIRLTAEMIEEIFPTAERKAPTNGNGQPKTKKFKRARRVSRGAETWRILRNYPEYEISSHGRVRSLTRANPDDCLKPRFVWHHGKVVLAVRLASGGKVYDRFVGPLLIQAGFLKAPDWMSKASHT